MSDSIFLTKEGKVWRELSCNGTLGMLDVEGITQCCQYEEGSLMVGGVRAKPGLTISKVQSYMPTRTGCFNNPVEVSGTPKAPPRTEGDYAHLVTDYVTQNIFDLLLLVFATLLN